MTTLQGKYTFDDNLTQEDLTLNFTNQNLWETHYIKPLPYQQIPVKKEEEQEYMSDSSHLLDDSSSLSIFHSVDCSFQISSLNKNSLSRENYKKIFSQIQKDVKTETLDEDAQQENTHPSIFDSMEGLSKEVNFSREPKPSIFPVNVPQSSPPQSGDQQKKESHQAQLRSRLKQIDYQMRELNVQKNRIKYFIRKQKNNMLDLQEESFETRACPCCGKLISKLCFKCEHIYCNPSNCSRKKKQRLNAKMLSKMKEKKGSTGRRRHSRSRDKNLKNEDNSLDTIEEVSFSSNELSNSDQSKFQDFTYEDKAFQTRSKVKEEPKWKMTMSDISLKESKLFLSSFQEEIQEQA